VVAPADLVAERLEQVLAVWVSEHASRRLRRDLLALLAELEDRATRLGLSPSWVGARGRRGAAHLGVERLAASAAMSGAPVTAAAS
jgi:hypothetical protein